MKTYRLAVATMALVIMTASGCARVAIYSDKDLKHETGVRFFSPKPYLLVAHTGSKDKPREVSIVYLPNLADSYYAQTKTGWGASEQSLTFSNGMLIGIGQKSDPKIPETIGALASLGTSVGGMATSFATANKIGREAAAIKPTSTELFGETSKSETFLRQIIAELEIEYKKCLAGYEKAYPYTVEECQEILNARNNLMEAQTNLSAQKYELAVTSLQLASNNLGTALKGKDDPSWQRNRSIRASGQIKAKIDKLIQELSPKPEEKLFELYEIDNSGQGLVLRPASQELLKYIPIEK